MWRPSLLAILSLFVFSLSGIVLAQDFPRLQPGDPPRAALITVSEPNEAGLVTIDGVQNAVFPTAQVAVRNLYTGETVYTQASIAGAFRATLSGTANAPYLISPSQGNIPNALRNRPGSLPGGPAVIVTGGQPVLEGLRARFGVAGGIGDDAAWTAEGRLNQTRFEVGDPTALTLELDVTMPDHVDVELASLRFIGLLALQPIAVQRGERLLAVGGAGSNNGWSGVLTDGGLPIEGAGAPIPLTEIAVEGSDAAQVLDGLAFRMNFEQRLPGGLPPGLYVPVLRGLVRAGDSAPLAWEDSPIFGGAGTGSSMHTRLPVVLNVGDVGDVTLPWALLMNAPSEGARGILPVDMQDYALSGRVRYNPPSYILPPNAADGTPIPYALEPALPMLLGNAYDASSTPLIPLALPGGRVLVRVQSPNGESFTTPGALPFAQNTIGSAALDERALFGAQSPLDMYSLTTFEPSVMRYTFAQYGEHLLTVEGEVSDIYGNTYTGGGEYRVVIAELLDMTPATLAGTPFVAGDAVNLGLSIAPAMEAEVSVRLRVYPLDGSAPLDVTYDGVASVGGYFQIDEDSPVLETAGEYVIDYEARFSDADGRFWAGSLRSAGVIAPPDGTLVGRGARGLFSPSVGQDQAWYDAAQVLDNADFGDLEDLVVAANAPYHSGDVLWLPDGAQNGLALRLTLQDLVGNYRDWLVGGAATDVSALGAALREGALIGQLPAALLNDEARLYDPSARAEAASRAYSYVSAINAGVTLRQFVSGEALAGLPLWVDMDDPLNGQIGTGSEGLQAGDYFFVFGGAVVQNAAAEVNTSSIYASAVIVTEADDDSGARIASAARGADGAADAGALLTLDEVSYDAFFVPTGVLPGSVLVEGDRFALSGQIAPALAAAYQARVTAPSGSVREASGRANAIGYVYDPSFDFAVEEAGVWTVDVWVTLDAPTSAGVPQPPFAEGGVLGAPAGRYYFYVAPGAAALLNDGARPDLRVPSALPYNFNLPLPQGWRDAEVYYTVTAPGLVLEQGILRPPGSSINYQYNPSNINRRFPNIEVDGITDGATGSDRRVVTFLIMATDENGSPQVLYRMYTFFHDRLISLDEREDS
jgi:hypothetical protein